VNPTIVIDTSALVEILIARNPDPELRRRTMTAVAAAPDIIDAETIGVVRRWEANGQLSTPVADQAISNLAVSGIVRMPHRSLLRRVWELRHSITPYDAAFVALAEQLSIPLIACDAKLAKAHGHNAQVELYPMG
jgi:predicted nucleic acid-binding protein